MSSGRCEIVKKFGRVMQQGTLWNDHTKDELGKFNPDSVGPISMETNLSYFNLIPFDSTWGSVNHPFDMLC